MEPRRDTVEPGAALGRFKLGERIGSGAMGTVYTALDPDLGRTVAIKVLHDEHARPRLLREAQAMARLAHPNVVPVHEIGIGERLFIVMELVSGGTVRQWLGEPRTSAEILDVFEQAGRGLAAAHAAGLVHRDFKPENILRGADGRVRVVDFGLVAARGERDEAALGDVSPLDLALTHTGLVLGTPAYMAPEQHRGEPADARSDQFALAVALYEALYGERPFAGATYREMVRNVYAGVVRPPRAGSPVMPHVRAALVRALAVDPGARYPSLDALLDALASPASPAVVRASSAGIGTRRRWRPVALLAIAAAVVVSTVIALAVTREDSPSAQPATEAAAPASATPPVTSDPPSTSTPPAPAPPEPEPATPSPRERSPVAPPPRAVEPPPPARPTTTAAPITTPVSRESPDEASERRRKQLELSE